MHSYFLRLVAAPFPTVYSHYYTQSIRSCTEIKESPPIESSNFKQLKSTLLHPEKLRFYLSKNGGSPLLAYGGDFLRTSTVLINLDLLNDVSPEVYDFYLAHEVAHLRNNDLILRPAVLGSATCLTSMALKYFSLPSTTFLRRTSQFLGRETLALVTGYVAFSRYSRFQEKRADLEAFLSCSNRTRNEAIAQLIAMQKRYLSDLSQLKQQYSALCSQDKNHPNTIHKIDKFVLSTLIWTASESGDNPLDLLHPTTSERIAYLTEANKQTL